MAAKKAVKSGILGIDIGGSGIEGALSVVLGFLLLREWPLTGLWSVGTLVGINLLFAGFAMISIGSAAHKVTEHAA